MQLDIVISCVVNVNWESDTMKSKVFRVPLKVSVLQIFYFRWAGSPKPNYLSFFLHSYGAPNTDWTCRLYWRTKQTISLYHQEKEMCHLQTGLFSPHSLAWFWRIMCARISLQIIKRYGETGSPWRHPRATGNQGDGQLFTSVLALIPLYSVFTFG